MFSVERTCLDVGVLGNTHSIEFRKIRDLESPPYLYLVGITQQNPDPDNWPESAQAATRTDSSGQDHTATRTPRAPAIQTGD